jgi:hypothetical protein
MMINLNEDPSAVYILSHGEVVMLDNEEFCVTETDIEPRLAEYFDSEIDMIKDGIYLSKNTSNLHLYNSFTDKKKNECEYSDYCIHVRDTSTDNFVIFDRGVLEHSIKAKDYIIS